MGIHTWLYTLTYPCQPLIEYGAGSEGEGACQLVFMLVCKLLPTPVSPPGEKELLR